MQGKSFFSPSNLSKPKYLFTSNTLPPNDMIPSTMSSTVTHWTEKGSYRIPSFTLWPSGLERYKINYHFPGWCFFGMTTKGLTWRLGNRGVENEPAIPLLVHFGRRSIPITNGWRLAEGSFCWVDLKETEAGLKPNRTPLWIPANKYSTGCWWRCADTTFKSLSTLMGETLWGDQWL